MAVLCGQERRGGGWEGLEWRYGIAQGPKRTGGKPGEREGDIGTWEKKGNKDNTKSAFRELTYMAGTR